MPAPRNQDFEDYLQNAIGFEKVDVIEPPGVDLSCFPGTA
jgi:hypothetical protein